MDSGASSAALPGAPREMFWVTIVVAALVQPLLVAKIWELSRRLGGFCSVWDGAKGVFWHLWSGRIEEVDMQVAVGSLLASRRVTIARTVIQGWWAVMAMFGLQRLLEAATKPSVVEAASFTAFDVPWLATLLSTTVGVAFPRTVVARTLTIWLWYGTLMYCGLTLYFPFLYDKDAFYFFLWRPVTVVFSVGLGALFLKFRSLFFANLCISICQIVAFNAYAPSCTKSQIGNLDLFKQELQLLLCRLVVLYCMELAVTRSAKKEIEAALGNCQLSAVFSLVGLVCDAVVDLDSDFVLKEHSTKLAGLLMHRPGKSLHGLPFTQFVAPDVDQRPRHWLSEELDLPGDLLCELKDPHPKMVSVRMRSADGTAFPVTLYHMPYHNIDGRLNHLIGLQEESDDRDGAWAPGVHRQRPLPAATLNAGVAEALVVGRSSEVAGRSLDDSLDGQIASLDSASRRSSGSSGSDSINVELGAIIVRAKEGLPIVCADNEVLSRLGLPEEGGSFLEAFSSSGPTFCKRLLTEAEKVRQGVESFVKVQCGDWYLGVKREDGNMKTNLCRLVAENRMCEEIGDTLIKISITELGPCRGGVSWRTRPGPLLIGSSSSCSAGHPERKVQL